MPGSYGYPRRHFTVDEYHQLIDADVLTKYDRVELLEGWIVQKPKYPPPMAATVSRLMYALMPILPERWAIRIKGAMTLTDSECEPDAAVIRNRGRVYCEHHPFPNDVGLVAEAADAMILESRRLKERIYARSGIPCYWVVNLIERRLEVHTRPSGPVASPTYRVRQMLDVDDSVPLILDGTKVATIPVKQLLL